MSDRFVQPSIAVMRGANAEARGIRLIEFEFSDRRATGDAKPRPDLTRIRFIHNDSVVRCSASLRKTLRAISIT